MMMDQWNEKLRCSACRKTGMAAMTQDQEADRPTVQSVPDGFKVVQTKHAPTFYCETCDVEVEL
jgi:hypothetical protein